MPTSSIAENLHFYSAQNLHFYSALDNLSLNVIENLIAHGICYGISMGKARSKAKKLLDFVGLSNQMNQEIDSLSGGMRRRVVLARALINEPKLLILDEPTTGLDIQSRHIIWDKLMELKQLGLSILLTSHYMDEVERLADRILIMNHGEISARGTIEELQKKYKKNNLEDVFLSITDD